jgi:DNA-binding response OmpR family regulator
MKDVAKGSVRMPMNEPTPQDLTPAENVSLQGVSDAGAAESPLAKVARAADATGERLLLLEEVAPEPSGITALLKVNGYEVVTCHSGVEFSALLSAETFDLVVFDWHIPNLQGLLLLDKLRAAIHATIPVLMLSNRASEYDVVQALNRGADDCMRKPCRPFELLARVNALLRRQRQFEKKQDDKFNDILIDGSTLQVTCRGVTTKLSNKEFLLIQLLLRHLDQPVPRALIAKTVWNRPDLEARTMDVHISRLRNKLGLNLGQGYALLSMYGFGYRLQRIAPEA